MKLKNTLLALTHSSLVFFLNNSFAAEELEKITVTGTKIEKSEFETPGASTTIDKQDMETIQAQKLSDVLRDVPGTNFSGGPRGLAEKPIIRGLTDSRILITVDGVRQNFTSGHKGRVFVEPELLKSVKVVRGAASSESAGGSTIGGSITMTTKDASDFLAEDEQFGIRLKTGFQNVSNEFLGTATMFGLGNLSGIDFDYLFSASARNSTDVRLATDDKNTEYLSDSSSHSHSSLSKISFLPNEHHKLTFSHQRSYTHGLIPIFPTGNYSAENEVVDRETIVTAPLLAYQYENEDTPLVNFRAKIYENKQTINELHIDTGNRFDKIEFTTPGFQISNTALFNTGKNINHLMTFGIDYHKDEMISNQGSAENTNYPHSESEYKSTYLQDQITFFKDWLLIPGVRFDDFKSQVDDQSELGGNAIFQNKDSSYQTTSYSLGILYKITRKTNVSLNYAQAFNAPTLQQLYVSGEHYMGTEFKPNPFLKPEVLTAGYEFSLKSRNNSILLMGDRGEIKWNVYHNTYDDFITLKTGGRYHQNENLDSVATYGSEIEANYYHPEIDGDVFLGLTFIEGENLNTKKALSNLPGNKAVIKIQKYLFNSELMTGLRGTFNLERKVSGSDSSGTESYNNYDFYATWSPPLFAWMNDAQVVFGIDNLFDTRFTPYSSILPSQGRNVKLTVSTQL